MQPLKIGILNVMHDKAATNERFRRVLTHSGIPVSLHFYYPKMHYPNGDVPTEVAAILDPLDLNEAATMDGFIITGSPIETIPFDQVKYIEEVHALLDVLQASVPSQLYLCWGGMAAINYFYQIPKANLPHKYFGVYAQNIVDESDLFAGLEDGFLAPHARYAEMDHARIASDPRLRLNAITPDDKLFMVSAKDAHQRFIFAHIEYDRNALDDEYQREIAAHPERHYVRAKNYYGDPVAYTDPQFTWATAQTRLFDNWISEVVANRQ